jgi:ureidoacrylate peracid hydrolase
MHTLNIDPWLVNRAKQSRDGRLNAYDRLDARKTALVVVDMQNYFVADGMPGCAPEARTIVPNINRLAQATRTVGGTVIWIQTEALIADPQDWANRKEAMSAADGQIVSRSWPSPATDLRSTPPARCRPRTRSRSSTATRRSFPIHRSSMACCASTISTRCSSPALPPARVASRPHVTPPCGVYRTIMVSDGNADHTDALHNHTLGKFLVTFGDVQATDDLLVKLGG